MSALSIFRAIRDTLRALPLDCDGTADDPAAEPLFHQVELYPNRRLGAALQKLALGRKRVCLVVPTNIRRIVSDPTGALSVLGRKYAEVSLVFSDLAWFKPEQAVTFGDDTHLGLFAFDERIEAALTGRELSPFGGIVCGDTDPVVLADAGARDLPGREAWTMQLYVPLPLIAAAVA